LRDAKTGPRAVPLGEAARAHIDALPDRRDLDAYLFPYYAGKQKPKALLDRWRAICSDAQISWLRLHDLRHYVDTLTMSCNSVWFWFYQHVRAAAAT